jgi:hypothetical protein
MLSQNVSLQKHTQSSQMIFYNKLHALYNPLAFGRKDFCFSLTVTGILKL